MGRIGESVARIGKAFGMRILAHRRHIPDQSEFEHVGLEALLRESDVVSLHCPLTEQTKELMNAARLKWMKPTAFLINTARGALVNEADLAEALNTGVIAGAGLDVLSVEPPPESNPLLSAKNCIITPHIAWATPHARRRLLQTTFENIQHWISETPGMWSTHINREPGLICGYATRPLIEHMPCQSSLGWLNPDSLSRVPCNVLL
jgi:glycerate dehydrogenase